MAGRPRKEVTPQQHADIVRLAKRRKGYREIVRITGLGPGIVRRVLEAQQLRKRSRTIRDDLTLRQCADLTGWSEPALLAAHRRGDLRLFQADGAWRCWPVELVRWCRGGPGRFQVERAVDRQLMADLLCEQWGTATDETERKAAQRARKAARDEGGGLGSLPRGSGRGER